MSTLDHVALNQDKQAGLSAHKPYLMKSRKEILNKLFRSAEVK